MIGLALVAAVGLAAAAEPPAAEDDRVSWYVVPNVGYDSDDRLGFGGRAEVAFLEAGVEPYRLSLVVQGYATVTGYHHHRVRVDRVGLGARGRLRLTAHLAYREWRNDGYWGVGNGTVREAAYAGPFDLDDPDRRRYRYRLTQPFAHIVARQELTDDGPWSVYGAVNPKWSRVQPYALSILTEQQPYGMAGGWSAQGMAGALYDTRQPQVVPHRGALLELGGRVSPPLDGEAGGFGGPLASARGYWSPVERLTLAGRVVGEWLFGSVPFYEMVHWGGFWPIQGFGGFETVRGIRFGRWRAPGKAVANLEARARVLTHPVGKTTLGWELAPFLDVGTVWGAGDAATAPAPAQPLHPAVGGGVRLIYDELFVGRLDGAVGWDPVAVAGGGVAMQRTSGIYLMFDYPY